MSVITRGDTISTTDRIDGDGGSASNKNLNDWLELATVGSIVHGDVATANKDGANATPCLRTLVVDGSSATAGAALGAADTRLAKLDSSGNATANKIATSGTAVSIGSTAPVAGQVLTATSATAATWQTPGASSEVTGTGTVTVTTSSTAIAGVGTLFLTQLKVGYLFKTAGGALRRISAIADNTNATASAAFSNNEAGAAYTFIQSAQPRPVNLIVAKTADYTVLATDAGNAFTGDTSGSGAFAFTLPAASSFLSGDCVTFKKINDDALAVTINRAGADTIDGATSYELKTIGAVVTMASDGVSNWRVIAKDRYAGQVLQRKFVKSATIPAVISTALAISGAPASTDGTEVLTGGSALTLTPISANTVIHVRVELFGGLTGGGRYFSAAVFEGTTIKGAGCRQWGDGSDRNMNCLAFGFNYTSGGTSAVTYKLICGPSGDSFYLNGNANGAALLGGNIYSFIEVKEVAI